MSTINEAKKVTGSLQPQELEAVYAISRAVAEAKTTDEVFEEIVQLARSVFIFDNVALYTVNPERNSLEIKYARAIGRGRSQEADLVWGESVAQQAFQRGENLSHMEQIGPIDENRTNLRYYLGLPLYAKGEGLGALVFIRFGGPPFTAQQINLAEFIAQHVAQLLQHRQLVERIAELEARRRLDSLQDDFISTITHELLTPLGFIKGYTTTLLRQDVQWDEATQHEFLTIISEEADRLRELIDNLMDSSRLQAGTLRLEFQRLRLDTLVRDVIARAQSRQPSLQIESDLRATNLYVMADPTRLGQVFENILNNAIKYAPGSKVVISLTELGGKAHIAIRDFGPGIPAQHLPHLFQRFYRVPEASHAVRGTGLGLYICRKIVQAHRGEITVESTLGEGTTFFIHLPLAPKSANS